MNWAQFITPYVKLSHFYKAKYRVMIKLDNYCPNTHSWKNNLKKVSSSGGCLPMTREAAEREFKLH